MGTSTKSMLRVLPALLTFILLCNTACAAEEAAEGDSHEQQEQEDNEEQEQNHPWIGSLLGINRRDLRGDDDMFWATRGKRNGGDDFWAIRGKKQYIKPNGFFQAFSKTSPGKKSMNLWRSGKRSLKPNGLFGSIKRSGLKPNGLFGAYKRDVRWSGNGLYKRAGLKPNGLFGAYKRAGLKPNGLFGAYKRAGLKPNGLFGAYKRAGLKPNGLFGAYKRSMIEDISDAPNDDLNEGMEYINYGGMEDEEEYPYDDDLANEKREDAKFWAARGKK